MSSSSQTKMPFRELPVRPRMAVPEWLPQKEGKEVKYVLSLVNGVYQMHKQEVCGVGLAYPLIKAFVNDYPYALIKNRGRKLMVWRRDWGCRDLDRRQHR